MKPDKEYKGRSHIRMFNCDCMDFMGIVKDPYDLAIVDPPYGNNAIFNGSADFANKQKQYDNKIPDDVYFGMIRILSYNQIVWGGNYFTNNLNPSRGWIVWDKLRFVKNYSRYELAWTSFDTNTNGFTYCNNGGFIVKDVDKPKISPSQKPVQLYKWLLTNYAKEGDRILDTHGGSLSIAIACWDLGFDLDVCELDKDYFDMAVKRFENHISQTQLF